MIHTFYLDTGKTCAACPYSAGYAAHGQIATACKQVSAPHRRKITNDKIHPDNNTQGYPEILICIQLRQCHRWRDHEQINLMRYGLARRKLTETWPTSLVEVIDNSRIIT